MVSFPKYFGPRTVKGEKVVAPNFPYDLRKGGWSLTEDVGFSPLITSVGELELVNFLRDDEATIMGHEAIKRSVELRANLGQAHVEWLVKNQRQIPPEWRRFYIEAPGTRWSHVDGDARMPSMYWDGEWWYWQWSGTLYSRWHGDMRLFRVQEP